MAGKDWSRGGEKALNTEGKQGKILACFGDIKKVPWCGPVFPYIRETGQGMKMQGLGAGGNYRSSAGH